MKIKKSLNIIIRFSSANHKMVPQALSLVHRTSESLEF